MVAWFAGTRYELTALQRHSSTAKHARRHETHAVTADPWFEKIEPANNWNRLLLAFPRRNKAQLSFQQHSSCERKLTHEPLLTAAKLPSGLLYLWFPVCIETTTSAFVLPITMLHNPVTVRCSIQATQSVESCALPSIKKAAILHRTYSTAIHLRNVLPPSLSFRTFFFTQLSCTSNIYIYI